MAVIEENSQERYLPNPSDRYRFQRKSQGRHVDQASGGFRLEESWYVSSRIEGSRAWRGREWDADRFGHWRYIEKMQMGDGVLDFSYVQGQPISLSSSARTAVLTARAYSFFPSS